METVVSVTGQWQEYYREIAAGNTPTVPPTTLNDLWGKHDQSEEFQAINDRMIQLYGPDADMWFIDPLRGSDHHLQHDPDVYWRNDLAVADALDLYDDTFKKYSKIDPRLEAAPVLSQGFRDEFAHDWGLGYGSIFDQTVGMGIDKNNEYFGAGIEGNWELGYGTHYQLLGRHKFLFGDGQNYDGQLNYMMQNLQGAYDMWANQNGITNFEDVPMLQDQTIPDTFEELQQRLDGIQGQGTDVEQNFLSQKLLTRYMFHELGESPSQEVRNRTANYILDQFQAQEGSPRFYDLGDITVLPNWVRTDQPLGHTTQVERYNARAAEIEGHLRDGTYNNWVSPIQLRTERERAEEPETEDPETQPEDPETQPEEPETQRPHPHRPHIPHIPAIHHETQTQQQEETQQEEQETQDEDEENQEETQEEDEDEDEQEENQQEQDEDEDEDEEQGQEPPEGFETWTDYFENLAINGTTITDEHLQNLGEYPGDKQNLGNMLHRYISNADHETAVRMTRLWAAWRHENVDDFMHEEFGDRIQTYGIDDPTREIPWAAHDSQGNVVLKDDPTLTQQRTGYDQVQFENHRVYMYDPTEHETPTFQHYQPPDNNYVQETPAPQIAQELDAGPENPVI